MDKLWLGVATGAVVGTALAVGAAAWYIEDRKEKIERGASREAIFYLENDNCRKAVSVVSALPDEEFFNKTKDITYRICTEKEIGKARVAEHAKSYASARDHLIDAVGYSSNTESHMFDEIQKLMDKVCRLGLENEMSRARENIGRRFFSDANKSLNEVQIFAQLGNLEMPKEYNDLRERAVRGETLEDRWEIPAFPYIGLTKPRDSRT